MESVGRIAVIDVGSNSIKLLVACRGAGEGRLKVEFSETIETRISAGIGKALPRLGEEGMREGLQAIAELLRMARNFTPLAIRIVATSAVRDAINGQEFAKSVLEQTGLSLEILSGEAEATYIGRGILCDPALRGIRDFLQVDIGGGSLELIRFTGGAVAQALSLPLGAVRLTEELVPNPEQPTGQEEAGAIRARVRDRIEKSGFRFATKDGPLVATGGAFVAARAVLAAEAGLSIDDYGSVLSKHKLVRLRERLCMLPMHDRMAIPHLPAARADILPTALITIETLLEVADRDTVTHSFCNLRYGIAAESLLDP